MTKQPSWIDALNLSPLARFAAEAFLEGFAKSFEKSEDDDDQFDPEPSDEVDVIAYLQKKVKRLERERDQWKAAAESEGGEHESLRDQLEEAWTTVRRLTRTIQAVYTAYEGLKEALHTSHFDE